MTIDDRYAVIAAGFAGDVTTATSGLSHSEGSVRASAIRALARMDALSITALEAGLIDSDAEVRRTAAELCATFSSVQCHHLLDDADVFVAEMTAWALGERSPISDTEMIALIDRTTSHSEAVVREACAAALGSIGDIRGLPAILAACSDKPAVRRRAILALAPFEGDEVDAALTSALTDKDWQVRQNAEDLLNPRG